MRTTKTKNPGTFVPDFFSRWQEQLGESVFERRSMIRRCRFRIVSRVDTVARTCLSWLHLMALFNDIYQKYHLHPASHMTSIENLSSILVDGLLSFNLAADKVHVSLANDDVQHSRASKLVPSSDNMTLHDYVPLYFGFKTPMIACNQRRNEEIIFLRISLDIFQEPGVFFTDGNARSRATKFYSFEGLQSLDVLNVQAIHTVKYRGDIETRRQKQAEILVPDRIDPSKILDIFVFSEEVKKRVLAILLQHGMEKRVSVAPHWYFKELS